MSTPTTPAPAPAAPKKFVTKAMALRALKVAIAAGAAGLAAYTAGGGTEGVAAAGGVLAVLREVDQALGN